jgi:hypothetical protein
MLQRRDAAVDYRALLFPATAAETANPWHRADYYPGTTFPTLPSETLFPSPIQDQATLELVGEFQNRTLDMLLASWAAGIVSGAENACQQFTRACTHTPADSLPATFFSNTPQNVSHPQYTYAGPPVLLNWNMPRLSDYLSSLPRYSYELWGPQTNITQPQREVAEQTPVMEGSEGSFGRGSEGSMDLLVSNYGGTCPSSGEHNLQALEPLGKHIDDLGRLRTRRADDVKIEAQPDGETNPQLRVREAARRFRCETCSATFKSTQVSVSFHSNLCLPVTSCRLYHLILADRNRKHEAPYPRPKPQARVKSDPS